MSRSLVKLTVLPITRDGSTYVLYLNPFDIQSVSGCVDGKASVRIRDDVNTLKTVENVAIVLERIDIANGK